MRNITTSNKLSDLKEKAVLVFDGMTTYFPQFGKRECLHISDLNLQPLTYAYNNGVVAFVDEQNDTRVIPAFQGISGFLENNGYKKRSFYVPFSNWDYPVAQEVYWKSLWEEKKSEK